MSYATDDNPKQESKIKLTKEQTERSQSNKEAAKKKLQAKRSKKNREVALKKLEQKKLLKKNVQRTLLPKIEEADCLQEPEENVLEAQFMKDWEAEADAMLENYGCC